MIFWGVFDEHEIEMNNGYDEHENGIDMGRDV